MKTGRFLFMMAFVLLMTVTAANAENKAGVFTFSPAIEYYIFDHDLNLEDDFLYGFDAGYNLTDQFGLELGARYFDTEADDDSSLDVEGNYYRLNGIYYFLPENALVPYVTLGLGAFTIDPDGSGSETEFSGNYGFGVKYFLTETLALNTDVRHTLTFPENNVNFGAGLTYYFGGMETKEEPPAPAPAPAPVVEVKDSDGDGVPDDADKCPDTPVGAKVDAQGCPLDTDRDGVIDFIDKCPGTPEGATVDERGCWIVKDLFFDFNKSIIKPQYYTTLDDVMVVLKNNPAMRVEIQGHTDSVGSDAYNQELSERRAKSVVDLLSRGGIEKSRLSFKGYGESVPAATNETDEGRAKNRRVEILPIY